MTCRSRFGSGGSCVRLSPWAPCRSCLGLPAVLTWLTGGLLALLAGLPIRQRRAGRVGVGLGILALPVGLVAFGIFALTQIA
jgi:hypothetical protein